MYIPLQKIHVWTWLNVCVCSYDWKRCVDIWHQPHAEDMGWGYSCEVRPVCIGIVFDGDWPGQIHLSDPSMQWVFLFLMTWGDSDFGMSILGCHTGHLVYAVPTFWRDGILGYPLCLQDVLGSSVFSTQKYSVDLASTKKKYKINGRPIFWEKQVQPKGSSGVESWIWTWGTLQNEWRSKTPIRFPQQGALRVLSVPDSC